MSHVGEVWEFVMPTFGSDIFLVIDDDRPSGRMLVLNLESGQIDEDYIAERLEDGAGWRRIL